MGKWTQDTDKNGIPYSAGQSQYHASTIPPPSPDPPSQPTVPPPNWKDISNYNLSDLGPELIVQTRESAVRVRDGP